MSNLTAQIELAMTVKNNLLSQLQNRIIEDKTNDFENVKDENKNNFIQEIADALKWEATKLEIEVDGYTNNSEGANEINDVCNDYADEALDLIENATK